MSIMMIKLSLKLFGHNTSIALEDEFMQELKHIARRNQLTIPEMVERIVGSSNCNRASKIRIYVLMDVMKRLDLDVTTIDELDEPVRAA